MKLRMVAVALVVLGAGLGLAGMAEANSCRSTAFLGCFLAGFELMAAGLFVAGAALLLFGVDVFRRWRAARAPAPPKDLAAMEAEIARIEDELEKLSRTGS